MRHLEMPWNQLVRTEGIRGSLILALILNVVFFPALWGGKTLLMSSRDAASIMPSGAYNPDMPAAGIGRTVDSGAPAWQSEPWIKIVCEQYGKEHNLPLWNPYSAFGTPLAAAMQPQPFYPLMILLCADPTPWTYNLMVIGRLFVAGLLTFVFARLFVTFLPSLFAAVAFMLSGYFILYMDMPHIAVDVLLPGVVLTLELLLRRNSWAAVAGVAGVVLLSAIGGMPESMFLIISFGSCYYLFRLACNSGFHDRIVARLGRAMVALTLGFALSAFLLLPFLEFMGVAYDSHQVANLGGHPRGLDFFDDGRAALTYLLPLVFGPVGNSILPGGGWTGTTGYWGVIQIVFALFAILSIFLSVESPRLRTLRSLTIFFAIMLTLMFLKRFGHPAINWIGHLPIANLIVYPKYLEPLMAFCVAMLAGLGFSRFLEMPGKIRKPLAVTAVMLVLGLMLALAGWSLPRVWKLNGLSFIYFLNVQAGILVITAVAMMLALEWRSKWTAWAWLGLISAELSCNFIVPCFYLFNSLPPLQINAYAGAPYLDFLKQRNVDGDRVFAREGFLHPNWAGAYGLADVRSLDGMFFKRYFTFIRSFLLKEGDEQRSTGDLVDRFTGTEAGYSYAFNSVAEGRFLALSSVKYLISGSEYGVSTKVLEDIIAQHRGENIWGFGADQFGRGSAKSAGLSQHPPSSRISYKTFIDPLRPIFEGVATIKSEAEDRSDGVGFLLEIRTGGKTETLFSELVNPREVAADRNGRPFRVDLSPYAGKDVEVLFSTDPGPNGNNAYDWAGWTRLRFVSQQTSETNDSMLPVKEVYEKEARIYENSAILPRASLFRAAEVLRDDQALARLKDTSFNPREKVVLSAESLPAEGIAALRAITEAPAVPAESAQIISYTSRRVTINAETSTPAVLMLNDTNYPGWRATLNGKPTPILQADYLFRGIVLPPGKSVVEFSYEPHSFRLGALISISALAILVVPAAVMYRRRRRHSRHEFPLRISSAE